MYWTTVAGDIGRCSHQRWSPPPSRHSIESVETGEAVAVAAVAVDAGVNFHWSNFGILKKKKTVEM